MLLSSAPRFLSPTILELRLSFSLIPEIAVQERQDASTLAKLSLWLFLLRCSEEHHQDFLPFFHKKLDWLSLVTPSNGQCRCYQG